MVRYDQLAHRWLIVMPIFGRAEERPDQPPDWTARPAAYQSPVGRPDQPGAAEPLYQPAASAQDAPGAQGAAPSAPSAPSAPRAQPKGPYSICYAISTTDDPLGSYYRYEFLRPLFPDY